MTTKFSFIPVVLLSSIVLLSSCKKPANLVGQDEPEIPNNAPNYSKSTNDDLAYLGRVLFYDKKLSADNTISCASCHSQDRAFADNQTFSDGVNGQRTTRNAPSIFPKVGRMFWDGRANNLDEMVLMPITNDIEMNIDNFNELCTKLSKTSYYSKLFKKAYNDEQITKDKIGTALKEFVLNFDFSKNRFKSSQGLIGTKLKGDEAKGKDLFFGKAKCSECHHVENNNMFGLSNGYGVTSESHNIGLDYESSDKGCGDISKNENENGHFMMPVLLNVELTPPYMHDGRFISLEEVVEHYNSKVVLNPNLDWRLKDFSDFASLQEARAKLDKNFNGQIDEEEAPNRAAQNLHLNDIEKAQLVQFLKTLTDRNILTDKKFSNPFVH